MIAKFIGVPVTLSPRRSRAMHDYLKVPTPDDETELFQTMILFENAWDRALQLILGWFIHPVHKAMIIISM
jgi:hypothetical protein